VRALALALLLSLGACTATATPLAEALVAMDKIHTNDLDAFKALVENSNAPQASKDFYLSRIAEDRGQLRALTDSALSLAEAIGKIDWTATALAAWKTYRDRGTK